MARLQVLLVSCPPGSCAAAPHASNWHFWLQQDYPRPARPGGGSRSPAAGSSGACVGANLLAVQLAAAVRRPPEFDPQKACVSGRNLGTPVQVRSARVLLWNGLGQRP